MAERPAMEVIYRFKQRLCYLLLKKYKTRRQCQKLVPRFLRAVVRVAPVRTGTTHRTRRHADAWSEEIARMWRFTRSSGTTEGFHNKMETITRQAYGFRNFENYRQRVQVLCA
jgi:transposase